ncbi:unnamed protein product [Vitrella brassicaformis CCMP3155]|uniref:PITH domain-containing protein n=1 Tax=Vitrella brassicaformis (strain CCMP3155) TaxID=1169540 RepID=A0A0G4GRY9_VITBC|nr:unnamed protein product [Vitrella brassicaformis CCMP3155]|mmetsp:Transcript_46363/g.115339  ORF Transcript_46363/g.115339 Transcript_46363/m.115339 type:complete len:212 (+) Transcript_46363:82-717(+)|eukprot:CEM33379.1 unnamed protein product [Vitrella brassicaformis CCMP3155]
MARTNNEATNTEKMRQHQLMKRMSAKPSGVHEEMDLAVCSDVIGFEQTLALNASSKFAKIREILEANPTDKSLVSDVDRQLILKISFKNPVTLTFISFRADVPPKPNPDTAGDGGGGGDDDDISPPSIIRIYSNKEDMDFDEVDRLEPSQTFELSKEQLSGQRLVLRGSRFQRCSSIQIFVEDNHGDTEQTFLNRVSLIGRSADSYHSSYR